MSSMLRYESGTGNESIEIDCPSIATDAALSLRGRQWEYDLGTHSVRSTIRRARAVHLRVGISDLEQADHMRRVMDRDVVRGTPGSFVVNGQWRQRTLILETEAKSCYGGAAEQQITAALLDGVWVRQHSAQFPIRPRVTGDAGIDYSYDYPFDYGRDMDISDIEITSVVPCDLKLTIYGPAADPYVVIGSNRYQVRIDVPNGAYLTVDSRLKTITLHGQDGSITDEFARGVRTTGTGSGAYIFEKIPPGTSGVSWDNTFGFDIDWYEEEGEPPWNLF